jgi:hypothetical protein
MAVQLCEHTKKPELYSITWFFFFFGSTGICAQGLTLARQVLYHLSHSLALFAVIIFGIRSSVFARGSP